MTDDPEKFVIEEVFASTTGGLPELQYISIRLPHTDNEVDKRAIIEGVADFVRYQRDPLAYINDLVLGLKAIEARLTSEPVQADGADMPLPPVPVDAKPTADQKVIAMVAWDDTIGEVADPSYKGLLDAEPFDPDAESEEDNG